MAKLYDPACEELANYFLQDLVPTATASEVQEFSRRLQDACEDFMTDLEEQRNG